MRVFVAHSSLIVLLYTYTYIIHYTSPYHIHIDMAVAHSSLIVLLYSDTSTFPLSTHPSFHSSTLPPSSFHPSTLFPSSTLPSFPFSTLPPSTLPPSILPLFHPSSLILKILVNLENPGQSWSILVKFNLTNIILYVTILLTKCFRKKVFTMLFTKCPEIIIISEKIQYFQAYFNLARISYQKGILKF